MSHLADEQIERYRTRSLDPEAILAVNDHLFSCKECFRRFQLSVSFDGEFGSIDLEPKPIHDYLYARLEAYVDGELAAPEKASFESHLMSCETCRADVDDLLAFKTSLAGDVSRQITAAAGDAIELKEKRKGTGFATAVWGARVSWMPFAATLLVAAVIAAAVIWKTNSALRRQINELDTQLASLRAANDRLLAQHDADVKQL